MNILIVGGAGYIGSHMVKVLAQNNHKTITLDNLSTGYRDSVKYGDFIEGDIANGTLLDEIFSSNDIQGVMHFSSNIEVGESVSNPSKYYRNNFANTINLLDAMVRHDVSNLVFSSTAAIFGEPRYTPIDEAHVKDPINAYGKTKYMVEMALQDYERAYGLRSICLRYFNAAGADPKGELGERHDPESHLIPLILQAASGRRDSISIFGQDYKTPDGSCVRDYIHIVDLCSAHLLAMNELMNGSKSRQFNLGNGLGFSVLEVIDVVKQITGNEFKVKEEVRRDGDPAILIADSSLARSELGWNPEYSDLNEIVKHAWRWEMAHFKGTSKF